MAAAAVGVCVYLHKYLLASIWLELVVPLVLDRLRFSQPKFNTQLKEPYFSARARESSFMRTANGDQRLSFATKPLTQNNETLCPPPWSSPSEPPSRWRSVFSRAHRKVCTSTFFGHSVVSAHTVYTFHTAVAAGKVNSQSSVRLIGKVRGTWRS